MFKPYQHITKILKKRDAPTATVCNALDGMHAIQPLVEEALPEDIRAHCKLTNWQGGILTLNTPSAAWATRVRYMAPTLMQTLRKHPQLASLRDVKCRVSLADPVVKKNPTHAYDKPQKASADASACVASTAEMVKDERLSAALKNLAKHIRR